jgi:superkiller protein 3
MALLASLLLIPLLAGAGCRSTRPDDRSTGPAAARTDAGAPGPIEGPAREPDAIIHFYRSYTSAAAAAAIRIRTPAPQLSPVNSGAGIVVCEPCPEGTRAGDLAPLGAGCARWLQFTLGGLGELGKTPLWASVDRTRHELGRRDLCLASDEAARLRDLTGVTHAAVGEISGTAGGCTLRYHLLQLPERKEIGPPLTLSGSEAQIVAGLPSLARDLAARLGVASPRLPAAVGASPAEMALLGRSGWLTDDTLMPAERAQLGAMARRVPLAAMAALRTSLADDDRRQAAIERDLIALAPDNPIVVGEIGWSSAAALAPHARLLQRGAVRFPANYLFAATESWLARSRGDAAGQRRAAERAVRCAPLNPDAWIALGESAYDTADGLRKGALQGEMSPSNKQAVGPLYEEYLDDETRATQLDPLHVRAWLHLSQAASFAGDRRTAEAAFDNALALCPVDPELFAWGLQMYQPKWFGDQAALNHLADTATTTTFARSSDALDIAGSLQQTGVSAQAHQLFWRAAREARAEVQRSPDSAAAHEDLARALRGAGDLRGATPEYQAVVRLRPDSASAHYALGKVLDERQMIREAAREFQATVRLDPQNSSAYYELGYALKNLGQFEESERAFRQALRIQPVYAEAHYGLGVLAEMRHRIPTAIQEYRQAVAEWPRFLMAWKRLPGLLAETKQYDAAIEAGEQAVELAPDDNETHDVLGYAYDLSHHRKEAVSEFDEAIRINSRDAMAHEDRGDTLDELGKTAEARQEWQKVLTLDHGAYAAEARQMLAKHPGK